MTFSAKGEKAALVRSVTYFLSINSISLGCSEGESVRERKRCEGSSFTDQEKSIKFNYGFSRVLVNIFFFFLVPHWNGFIE